MDDVAPTLPTLLEPPRRDRRILVTAVVSAALHLLVLGWLLLPRTQTLIPTEPAAVNVDLVPPPSVVSSGEPSSSEAPSSVLPSSEPMSSAEASSSAAPSSAEPPSSTEAASAAAASSEAAASAASAPPIPQARPLLVPVGPSAPSSELTSSVEDASASASEESAASEVASSAEASSEASAADTASLLTTSAADASEGVDPTASSAAEETPKPDTPKPPSGALHVAKRYYSAAILSAPQMAKVGEALKTLPKDKRLAQTCNIEAIGQLGNAGRGYAPDAVVASAFAKPVIAGTTYRVANGAFRTKGKWLGLAYECTLSDNLDGVASFTYRVGGDVSALMLPLVNGAKKP